MGFTSSSGHCQWGGPRAILKSRDEKWKLENEILRSEIDMDWDDLDSEIWVHFKD